MVHRRNDLPPPNGGQKPLKFLPHGLLAVLHAHLIKVTEEGHLRLLVQVGGNVHPGLALQGEHTVRSHLGVPIHCLGDVPVGINEHGNTVLVDDGDDLAVERREEFIEAGLRDHGSQVVAHVLGKAHEIKVKAGKDVAEQLDEPIRIGLAHLMVQLGSVIEAVEVILDTEQDAGIPEKSLYCEKMQGVAAVVGPLEIGEMLLGDHYFHGREQGLFHPFPIRLVLHDAETLSGCPRGGGSTAVGVGLYALVQTEIILDLFYRYVFLREAIPAPTADGHIPPRYPLHRRSAVYGEPRQIAAETLGCGHLLRHHQFSFPVTV